MKKSFSEIYSYTKEKLAHASRYTENEFSFLKIYQHALKFTLEKQQQKLIRNYFRFPFWCQLSIYTLKSKRKSPKTERPHLKEFVILDPGRAVLGDDGNWHSMYFDKITELIGRENLSIICTANESSVPYDININTVHFKLPSLDSTEKKLLREINSSIKKANSSKQFNPLELEHLRSEMHLFFESFRLYYNLLIIL